MPRTLGTAIKRYDYPIASQGYGTLYDILLRRGATDPRLMNRNLADLDIQNQAIQRQTEAGLARGGLGGSIGGQALLGAERAGGGQQRSDYLAREAALQEQRQREDLQLMQLLFGPKFQRQGLRNQMRISRMNQGGGGVDWGGILGGAGTAVGAFA